VSYSTFFVAFLSLLALGSPSLEDYWQVQANAKRTALVCRGLRLHFGKLGPS